MNLFCTEKQGSEALRFSPLPLSQIVSPAGASAQERQDRVKAPDKARNQLVHAAGAAERTAEKSR